MVRANPAVLDELLEGFSPLQIQSLLFNWKLWARPDQITPPELMPGGGKHTWLILAGRGWGKTKTGSQFVIDEVRAGRAKRIALVGETAADVRDVIVEGDSGILASSPPDFKPVYESSKRRLTWPNGALATTYNATEPDQLRGPQHDLAWCDELAKWQYAQDTFDQLQFGLRLGQHPRQLVTTTPRPIPVVRDLVADPYTHITRGRTLDNAANLAKTFLQKIVKKYEGTRLGRQELDGEILGDLPGALWTRNMIDLAQTHIDRVPPMEQVVVSIDPSGTSGEDDDGDSVGITVVGKAGDNAYILADLTCKESPGEWAARAIGAFHRYNADRIVAEVNFGGAMVEHTIKTVDRDVPVRVVHASRGKFIRAEPVSSLYEQRRVKHVGSFPELEDQMCLLTRAGFQGRGSPDRLDAAVWAITDLMLADNEINGTYTSIRGIY